MIQYPKPAKPEDFDERVASAVIDVREAFETSVRPIRFPAKWGDFKAHFFKAQHNKCGYCESQVRASSNGDVEHYYPKAEVWTLIEDGEEAENLSNVRGRKHEILSQGYWWQAYEWTNYLLSCGNCNSKWKRNFFPVAQDPRTPAVDENNKDKPLVLHPFGRSRPEVHLRFRRDTSVVGLSKKGRNTIRICGLDRPSLREARGERTEQVIELVDQLVAALTDNDELAITAALLSLHRVGAARRSYVGVTRSITKHEAGLNWTDVEDFVLAALIEQLAAATGAARDTALLHIQTRYLDFDDRDALADAVEAETGVAAADLFPGLFS